MDEVDAEYYAGGLRELADDLEDTLVRPDVEYFRAAASFIERQQAELEDWRQAAGVEAGLRREFLARAEAAEERLLALSNGESNSG